MYIIVVVVKVYCCWKPTRVIVVFVCEVSKLQLARDLQQLNLIICYICVHTNTDTRRCTHAHINKWQCVPVCMLLPYKHTHLFIILYLKQSLAHVTKQLQPVETERRNCNTL